jgi:hypothetical protein
MKIFRLVGTTLFAVLVTSAVLGSTASAETELRLFTDGASYVTLYGLTLILFTGENLHIDCLKSLERALATDVGVMIEPVSDHFLNCVAVNNATSKGCPVKSTNASEEGLILAAVSGSTLRGYAGLILPSKAVGILFLSVEGSRAPVWIDIAANTTCETPELKVEGDVAAEITPTGKLQTTGKLLFRATSGKQAISDFDLNGGATLQVPKLLASGSEVVITREGTYTASKAFEVT